jgi:trigger factor
MEAKLKDKQSVEATVEVTVPAAEVDKAYERVLRQLGRQVRVPGFRPGKAPRGVLIRRVGKEALEGEVREELIENHYPAAMKQFELNPVHAHVHGGMPAEGEAFTFDLHVDLYPDIELPELTEIVIDSDSRQVDEEMIAATVARLQGENAAMVPVDRPVREGDYLLVETVSEEEGGAGSTMPIDLESVSEELANQLIGKSAGEVVALRLADAPEKATEAATTAQSDDPGTDEAATNESAEGVAAEEAEPTAEAAPTLEVRIKDVKEKDKPQADDDFAKTLGFETWQETEERIRESLQSQLDQEAFEEQREEFVEKLVAAGTFELPRSLVQRRRADLLENLADDLRRRGLTIEKYMERLEGNQGREEFERELQEAAEKGVRRDLVLERLLEQRQTKLSDAEFDMALRQLAMQQGTDVERLRRERGNDWLRNYRFLLTRDRALGDAVRERLAAQRGESAPDAAAALAPVAEPAMEPAAVAEPAPDTEASAGSSEAGAAGAATEEDDKAST